VSSESVPSFCSAKTDVLAHISGLNIDQMLLEHQLVKRNPKTVEHFNKHKIPFSLLTTRWFLCMFIDVLPYDVSVIPRIYCP